MSAERKPTTKSLRPSRLCGFRWRNENPHTLRRARKRLIDWRVGLCSASRVCILFSRSADAIEVLCCSDEQFSLSRRNGRPDRTFAHFDGGENFELVTGAEHDH